MTIAVALALYNGARFLEKQLDTIRLQTRKPDQVVLCDDGSKDNTVEIVRDYIRKYGLEESWQLYVNGENLGYIRNFYRAISLCNTSLVFLSDQDDLWKNDKIEKMTQIMEQREEIMLLSCKYGIIDASDREQHSVVERKAKEDGSIRKIAVKDIMRAYRWPGMLMCVRKTFFDKIHSAIEDCAVAHDLMLAVNASDRDGFFEYNYVGAFHRRHDNNAAREEHRVFKLLNMELKLREITVTKKLWQILTLEKIPIRDESRDIIQKRLTLLEHREQALRNRNLSQVLRIYKDDNGELLRIASLLCDIWLVCFGRYSKK